jgi:serine/threonine-protein kinase
MMPFTENQQVLHYRLTEKIGEGGMGVVWSAVDTTLDRHVAIKVLPELLAADPDRLARFEREAKLLAALDHPNIASVYGLHEFEGRRFIAMELVPGEDLAQRLERGPIPIEDAIDIARQTAAALEAAHEQGVIHRDLKPANIKCTPDGKVKVLDLGLAKALVHETSGDSPSISLSPTVTSAGTIAGTLLGTAAYMSPEQAKGRPVDRRADIWAFGVVLYEMLTGRNPFVADTISETLAAVLRDQITCQALPDGTPPTVSILLERCLDRDVDGRLRDIGEARIVLGGGASVLSHPTGSSETPGMTPSPRPPKLPWLVTAVLAVITLVALWGASSSPMVERPLLKLAAPLDASWTLPGNQMGVLALAPDGSKMAIALNVGAKEKLFVRFLDSGAWVEMDGTENASTPFFSPDGEWIGFFADDKLKKVPSAGGAPVTLCDSKGQNRGGDWGTDGQIVFSPHFTMPLMTVSASGGEPVRLTEVDADKGERTHRWPQSVPGQDLILYTVGTIDSPENYDDAEIHALRPSTGEKKMILKRASMARYLPSGHLVFGREGFLFAAAFDVDRLELSGSPVPVVEGVMGMHSSGAVHVGFADNGVMAYVEGVARTVETRLVWRDRDGQREVIPSRVAGYYNPSISPDGTQVALEVAGGSNYDIWTYQFGRETLTRLTFEGDNISPLWLPDGASVTFASVRDNALRSIYRKASDGSGQAELLLAPPRISDSGRTGGVESLGWFDGGRSMVIEYTDENSINVGTYSPESDEFNVLMDTPATEAAPALSPDERWLAYSTDEQGEFQLFVREFPGPGGKWQVSTAGGVGARWSPDGNELFYRFDRSLYGVRIDTDNGRFRAGQPEVIFDDLEPMADDRDFDVLNSERFLVVEKIGQDSLLSGVTVVVNWTEELNRLVPQ